MSVKSLVLVWLYNELIYKETFEFKLKIWMCIISRVSDMHSRFWIFLMYGFVWNTFPHEDLVYHHMFHKCMLFPSFHLTHFVWSTLYNLCIFFSGCGIIMCSIPFSLCWLSDVEVLPLVDAPPPGRKSPTRGLYVAHWIGIAFLATFHIQNVCIDDWNLQTPEE